jgi:YD repeat-containing protein
MKPSKALTIKKHEVQLRVYWETTCEYNGSGQLKKQTDPNGNVYTFEYYADSRLQYKIGSEGTYTYYYESGNNGKNMLSLMQGPNGFIKYTYDNQQRLTKLEENYFNEPYISQMQYDNFGNQIKYIYPSSFAIKKHYDNKGNLIQISRDDNNENIWHLDEMNGMGKIWKYTNGDNNQTKLTYSNDRRLSLIDNPNSTGKWSYTYDIHNGNVLSRTRIGPRKSEAVLRFTLI